MMRGWKLVAMACVVALSWTSPGMGEGGKKPKPAKAQVKPGKVFHVVVFKFKEGVTKEQIEKVCEEFRGLRKKIPEVAGYKAGANISPEGLNKGFTHCFIVTFKNTKDRDIYLDHPAHKEFAKGLGAVLADVFVVDFEAR
jgi:hypothetical protein